MINRSPHRVSVPDHSGSRAVRVIPVLLITLGLLVATAVTTPVVGRADTVYPVLLVHGGIGSPADSIKWSAG